MTPTEKIDDAINLLIKSGNFVMLEYPNTEGLNRMRAAMQKIMTDEYKAGSNAVHKAMKGK